MATKMFFYVGSEFEWSLRNYFLMREKTFKRLRNELYNKQLQKLMLLDGCRRSLFFFTGINRSSCSFESRSIYIYIYINDVTPKESGIAVIFCQSPGMPMSLLVWPKKNKQSYVHIAIDVL
jgi:hypothetical protein